MSKCCDQCGLKHRDDAIKCVNCGAVFESIPSKLNSKKKTVIIGGVIGAVLIAAIIFSVVIFTGPEWAVRRIMQSYKSNDAEAIVDSFPSFLTESEGASKEQFVQEISSSVKLMSEYIFSYNIDKAQTPSDREREELMEAFAFYAGDDFDESDIQDIKLVWVNFKGNVTGVWPSNATRFIMVKCEGRWCWWPYNVNR